MMSGRRLLLGELQARYLEAEHAHTVLPTGHEPPLLIGAELDSLDVVVRDVLGQQLSLRNTQCIFASGLTMLGCAVKQVRNAALGVYFTTRSALHAQAR